MRTSEDDLKALAHQLDPRNRKWAMRESQPEFVAAEMVSGEEGDVLYTDDLVTVYLDGRVKVRSRQKDNLKHVLKTLRLVKKQALTEKREINAALRDVRHDYTDYVRRRGSMFKGGGTVGQFIRLFQTISRDAQRWTLANSIEPFHEKKRQIESILINLDKHVIEIESFLAS